MADLGTWAEPQGEGAQAEKGEATKARKGAKPLHDLHPKVWQSVNIETKGDLS
jgi:hypothetical protein